MDVKQPKPKQIGAVRSNIGPSLLDPSTIRNIISGADFRKKSEVWDHLLINDARIRAAWTQRMAAQQSILYTVISPIPENKKYVEIFQNFITQCHDSIIQNIMDARGRGISVMITEFALIDGIVCPVGCQSISPYVLNIKWDTTNNNYIITYETITGAHENINNVIGSVVVVDQSVMVPPHQRGIWIPLSWLYSQKRKALRDWQIASSKIGVPITIATKPENSTDEMDSELINAVESLDTRSSILIPYGTTVSISDGISRGDVSQIFEKQITYCDQEITLAILGQSASMMGTPGSLGSENIRDAVRIDVIDSDSNFVKHYINQILTMFCASNSLNNIKINRS